MNETMVGHKARVLMDRGRFLILEGQGPVQGAKYLVVLTEGGVPPVEQRMPRTRVAG